MPSPNAISVDKLARLIGTPRRLALIDVRSPVDLSADPRSIPGAIRRSAEEAPRWASEYAGRSAIVICQLGHQRSEGVAAWLRQAGAAAEVLTGGHAAWVESGLPLVTETNLPRRDAAGRTVWVTRARPKVDRIACPWLIRRFVDPEAVFLFVAPSEVLGVAEQFGAAPLDVEGVFWSHRGESCSFDTMLAELELRSQPLQRMAAIVRGADTARLDLAPEAAGLLAVSLGFSRMYADDLEQLEAVLPFYDALYRWARDATDETHNWPTNKPSRST